MLRNWAVAIETEHNHLRVELEGQERIGLCWVTIEGLPSLDLICDPVENSRQLLKDALTALIEHL